MNAHEKISFYIEHLKLIPHPEGGYYAETYRSPEIIDTERGKRHVSTGIYFLQRKGDISKLHRIKSDEMWHFYDGDPYELTMINPSTQKEEIIILGKDITKGEFLQFVVPKGYWFGGKPTEGAEFCLMGCTVAPGFDFNDFEMK